MEPSIISDSAGIYATGREADARDHALEKLYDLLKPVPKDKVCILGVGNRLRGDDGAGPRLIDKIQGCVSVACIDCGIAPENYLEKVIAIQPSTILIIDATEIGERPGEIHLFSSDQQFAGGLSTHALSLTMVCDYLKARISPQIYLLAIQPALIIFKDELSAAVSMSVDLLAKTLKEVLHHA